MKKNIITQLLLLLIISLPVMTTAQDRPFIAGAEGSYFTPIGKLGERFQNTAGFSVYAGKQTSDRTTWLGRFEYFKYDQVNKEKMEISQEILVGINKKKFSAKLTQIKMDLEVAGLSVNMKSTIFDAGFMKTSLDLGFGFYRWTFHRQAHDSIMVDSSGTAGVNKFFTLLQSAPPATQQDWSGGFSAGLEMDIAVAGPVWITLAGNYKNIVGELWPALALNMENVSTFQMLDLRAGVRVKLGR